MPFLAMVPIKDWLYLGEITLLIAAGVWFSHSRYEAGYGAAKTVCQAEAAKVQATAQAALEAANAHTKAVEDAAQKATTDIATNYVTKEDHEQAVNDARATALRSGATRLRVAVDPGSCRSVVSSSASAASGPDGAAAVDIQSEVAARLDRTAADADRNTDQLSTLQDWVRRVVK